MKNIKKSVLFATALFAATSIYANNTHNNNHNQEGKNCKSHKSVNNKEGYKNYHGYKNHDKKQRRGHRGDISRFIIGAVYDLKLEKTQITKIDETIQEFKNKRFDRFNAFKKDGFDKKAYIEARTKTKEDKIKLKADLIEDIYAILNKEQKDKLNKEIQTFKNMKNKRGKNGSSCHDRR